MHIIHNTIGEPQLRIKEETRTSCSVTLGPLPTGYGITIGNALRRTLLSSLPGTAVIAYKIDGITHEYDTIEGVKESVFDIGLNLRSLDIAKHTHGEEIVEVKFKKSGVVTAADIKVSSDIEILDPSQILFTCEKADAKRVMYLKIEKNVGHRLINNKDNANNEDVEFMLLDSVFSPIKSVRYTANPARVGDNTDLDELQVDLTTNGGMKALEAIKFAADLLKSYFSIFNIDDAYTDAEFITSFEEMKRKRESEQLAAAQATEMSFTPIDILGLSQRTLNALVNGGITSVEQLLTTSMGQLVQLRGFGQKAKTELDEVLKEQGYTNSTLPKPEDINIPTE